MLNQVLGCHTIIINNKGNLLILKRSSDDKNDSDKFDIPGGGINKNEDLTKGIKREVKEEAGLEIEKIEIIGAYTIDDDSLQLLAKAQSVGDRVELSSEHSCFKWVDEKEFLAFSPTGLHLKAAQNIIKTNQRVILYLSY